MKYATAILLLALLAVACSLGDRTPVSINGNNVDIDRCLAPIIKALNDGGVKTISSCCGHGEGNGYIWLEDRILIVTPKTNWAGSKALYLKDWNSMAQSWQRKRETKQ